MTTPVTVSQYTRQPEARTIPPRPAIVAAPGGRRGEAPGRRTSRRVPASPTISAGDRYGTGESGEPAAAPSPVRPRSRQRVAASRRTIASPARARERGTALRGRVRASAAPPSRSRRARARRILLFENHHEPRSVARRDPSGRGRAIALGVGPPTRRTGARKHAVRADARAPPSAPDAGERSRARPRPAPVVKPRSLVDPASSHMLVSKIKPCMSQCKPH